MLLNFDNYINIIIRRKYLILFALISICILPMLLVYCFAHSVYKTSGNIKIMFSDSQTSYLANTPGNIAVLNYYDKTQVDDTFFEMIKNPKSLQRLIAKFKLTDKSGKVLKPDDININGELSLYFKQEGISVDLAQDAEIIEVSGYAKTPEKAEKLTNYAIKYFLELYAGIFKHQALSAQKALKIELAQIKQQILNVENAKIKFCQKNKLVDFKKEEDFTFDQYYNYKQKLNNSLQALSESKAQLEKIKLILKQTPHFDVTKEVIQRNSLIDQYKSQIVTLEMNLAKLKVEYLPHHPDIIATGKQIEKLRNALKLELSKTFSTESKTQSTFYVDLYQNYYNTKITMQVLNTTIEKSRVQLDRYKAKLNELKKLEAISDTFSRELAQLEKNYSVVKQGIEETRVVINMNPANAAVLNYADASMIDVKKPYFPNYVKTFCILFFLAASFSFCLLILAETTDPTIFDINNLPQNKDSKFLRGLPKYGIFFRLKGGKLSDKEKICRYFFRNTAYHKSLNSIIAGISAYNKNHTLPRTMLFAGADFKSGTSTLAYAIAIFLADNNKKVLFVSIAEEYKKKKEEQPQIPDVTDDSFDKQIRKTQNIKLDELIINEAKISTGGTLISTLKDMPYDYLIINTEPVINNYTAACIGNVVDAMVIVAKFRKTSRKIINNAIAAFNTKENKIVIINQI